MKYKAKEQTKTSRQLVSDVWLWWHSRLTLQLLHQPLQPLCIRRPRLLSTVENFYFQTNLKQCTFYYGSTWLHTHTDTHTSFYRPDALPAAKPTASKHCRSTVKATTHFASQTSSASYVGCKRDTARICYWAPCCGAAAGTALSSKPAAATGTTRC